MIGTAEDHHSNPMKVALEQSSSARAAASSRLICAHRLLPPSRTNGSPSGPEPTARCSWRCCGMLRNDRGPALPGASPMRRNWWCWTSEREAAPSGRRPAGDGHGPHNKLAWDLASQALPYPQGRGIRPRAGGHFTMADGTRVAPAFQLLRERVARDDAGGLRRSPASPAASASWRARWATIRAAPDLRTAQPGPTPGGKRHPRRPATGGLPRDARTGNGAPTGSRRCARWPCS